MNFGYFDDEKREYVITRPDTPAPWANYLGSPEYGALISNNAGGYSFARSGANGRILRYIFNQFDQPGRYIYLRDNESKDYWSASWQPVEKDLDRYKSECHHGTAYTKMFADYSGIHSEVCYYVPLNETYEVWHLKVTNASERTRELTITGYAEFTNNNNYEQDQVNLQYSQFITSTVFEKNRIRHIIHGNLDWVKEGEEVDNKLAISRFFALAGAPVDSYCGDKESFLGRYHGYHNPAGVENGTLSNEMCYNENGCGALDTVMILQPGETKEIAFLVGMKESDEAENICMRYEDVKAQCEKERKELISYWHEKLEHFQVHTPSPEFDTMINTWNAYNCFMTFIWSRAASFFYCGLRNGYGYRDTVQDIQGIIHLAPEMALEKIRFMLSAQVDNGGGLPLVKFTHNAGHEDTPDDASYVQKTGHPAYRADDALWLFPTVYKYIAESGNLAFIDEVIPFANQDEATVYEHLKRALAFSMNHLGPHGLPAGLYADWNDCLRLGKNGESSFVALQFYYAMTILKQFAVYKKDQTYADYLEEEQQKLGTLINELCWNEDRFIRGFTEAGEVIGKRTDPEANLWLNPQSWAVISGLATRQQAEYAHFLGKEDDVTMDAGFMWQEMKRELKEQQIEASIRMFAPLCVPAEVMQVRITNKSDADMRIRVTSAIPMYGRSADNLRDHRHVTSLLHRICTTDYGVLCRPVLSFDERGHQKNDMVYFEIGSQGDGTKPEAFFPTVESFIGETGTFLAPDALKNGKKGYPAGYITGRLQSRNM